jgi:hypothetical protein
MKNHFTFQQFGLELFYPVLVVDARLLLSSHWHASYLLTVHNEVTWTFCIVYYTLVLLLQLLQVFHQLLFVELLNLL